MTFSGLKQLLVDLHDHVFRRTERMAAKTFLDALQADVAAAFAAGRDPVTGAPWPPRKRPSPGPLLVRTGRLRDAAVAAAGAARGGEYGGGVTVELSAPEYAAYHQHGTGRVPRRRFFGVSPQTAAKVAKWHADEIVRLVVRKK